MKSLVFSVLFIFFIPLVIYLSSCTATNNNETKPNIIIINVDDLGWKDVGYMGTEFYETPNIDYLSTRGMVFTDGYASAANCAPSRACMMTGKWPSRHGVYTVGSSERGKSKFRKIIPVANTVTLSKDHLVFPKILQENGYTTFHAGKWHLSDDPLEYGFHVNIGGGHNGHPSSYYPPYKNVNIQDGKNEYLTDLIMEKTIEFVDTISSPFFLYYSPYAVHTPIQPIDSFINKYIDKPVWGGQENIEYATMIENLDKNIGLLLSKLEEKKHLNTLIIFTSDNGGLFGITRQEPLRAGKGSYYEGGIRVPFLFVWKGKIRANAKSDIPITNLDVFPTLLSVLGLEVKKYGLDGADLMPILEENSESLDRPLFWHFPIYLQAYKKGNHENRDSLFRTRPGSVVRLGKWKLHYYFENKEVELYDLEKDIGERNDLSNTLPTKTDEMLHLLNKHWEKTGSPIPVQMNPEYAPFQKGVQKGAD